MYIENVGNGRSIARKNSLRRTQSATGILQRYPNSKSVAPSNLEQGDVCNANKFKRSWSATNAYGCHGKTKGLIEPMVYGYTSQKLVCGTQTKTNLNDNQDNSTYIADYVPTDAELGVIEDIDER